MVQPQVAPGQHRRHGAPPGGGVEQVGRAALDDRPGRRYGGQLERRPGVRHRGEGPAALRRDAAGAGRDLAPGCQPAGGVDERRQPGRQQGRRRLSGHRPGRGPGCGPPARRRRPRPGCPAGAGRGPSAPAAGRARWPRRWRSTPRPRRATPAARPARRTAERRGGPRARPRCASPGRRSPRGGRPSRQRPARPARPPRASGAATGCPARCRGARRRAGPASRRAGSGRRGRARRRSRGTRPTPAARARRGRPAPTRRGRARRRRAAAGQPVLTHWTSCQRRRRDLMTLSVGDLAPDFELKDQHGQSVRLSSLRGEKAALVVFYPWAFSGVCGGELCALKERQHEIVGDDVVLLTISTDPMYALRAFADHNELQLPAAVGLLAARRGRVGVRRAQRAGRHRPAWHLPRRQGRASCAGRSSTTSRTPATSTTTRGRSPTL